MLIHDSLALHDLIQFSFLKFLSFSLSLFFLCRVCVDFDFLVDCCALFCIFLFRKMKEPRYFILFVYLYIYIYINIYLSLLCAITQMHFFSLAKTVCSRNYIPDR